MGLMPKLSVSCDRCVAALLSSPQREPENNKDKYNQIKSIRPRLPQFCQQIGLIVMDIAGSVQMLTERSEQLLYQYSLSHTPNTLPEPLQKWFKHPIARLLAKDDQAFSCSPLRLEQEGRQLIIFLIPTLIGEQFLLLLEEQELPSFSIAALELLGLTKREAEVLFWIARDKSNAAIAKVIGCSEGTVRKHLEHIHGKLGVQTRTAAVIVALEKLGLLKGQIAAISS